MVGYSINVLQAEQKRQHVKVSTYHPPCFHLVLGEPWCGYPPKTLFCGVILLMEEILHQLICSLSHYLQGFIHPTWLFGISSIHSSVRHLSCGLSEHILSPEGMNFISSVARPCHTLLTSVLVHSPPANRCVEVVCVLGYGTWWRSTYDRIWLLLNEFYLTSNPLIMLI